MDLVQLLKKLISEQAEEKVILEPNEEAVKIIQLIFETTGVDNYDVEALKKVLENAEHLQELINTLKELEVFEGLNGEEIVNYIAGAINLLELPDDNEDKAEIMKMLNSSDSNVDGNADSKEEKEAEQEQTEAKANVDTDNEPENESEVAVNSSNTGFKFSWGREIELELETETGKVKKVVVKLVSPEQEVDTTPWGKVDKTELRRFVVNLAKNLKSTKDLNKVERIANHIFGIVKCVDKVDCLKFPFAVIRKTADNNYEVVVNEGGVRTAVVYMTFPNVVKSYTKKELDLLKSKLSRLYKLMKLTLPPVLKNNSSIVIAPQFAIEDIANELNIKVEDVGNIVYLINGLANILYKAGYIQPEVDDELVNSAVDGEESQTEIMLPLDADSFKVFYKGIEKGINYIINAFIGNTEALEKDSETVANSQQELLNKIEALLNQVKLLEAENAELKQQLEELKAEEEKLKQMVNSKSLVEEKYNILLEIASEKLDKMFIEALSNANDFKELEFIKKFLFKSLSKSINSANKTLFKVNNKEVVNSLAATPDVPIQTETKIELAKKESELDILANYI